MSFSRFSEPPILTSVRRTLGLVAQCSATPATVAATPPCSATPFQTQISVRHLRECGGKRCDTKILRGCSATPVLHLQKRYKIQEISCDTCSATGGTRNRVQLRPWDRKISSPSPKTLLLLNGLNKEKEVIAPLFKIRGLGHRPLETPRFLGQNSFGAFHSTSLNKEVVTSLIRVLILFKGFSSNRENKQAAAGASASSLFSALQRQSSTSCTCSSTWPIPIWCALPCTGYGWLSLPPGPKRVLPPTRIPPPPHVHA